MGAKDFLTSVDIFGSPFNFEMGVGKAKRKTAFGGLLSIFLLGVGILYFAYLNYLFANNLIMPKITSQQIQFKKDQKFAFDSSIISFDQQNIDDNTNLMDYLEKNNFPAVVQYTATLHQSDSKGTSLPAINIPVTFCSKVTTDPNVDPKSQCFDFSGIPEAQRYIMLFPQGGSDTYIEVEWATVCDPATPPCSQDDQDAYVFGSEWTFNLNVKQQQFDATEGALADKIEVVSWDFDTSLTTISTLTLQTSQTTVKDGFIVQIPTVHTFFSSQTNQDSFKTRGLSAKVDPLVVFKFTIRVDNTQFQDMIQYAQYPEILAQFGSIVNVLLIVGIIGVIVAKADIQNYFVDQKLKEYYRQTAYKILTSDGKQLMGNKEQGTVDANDSKVNKDQVIKIMKEIDSKDMNAELTKKIKVSMLAKVLKSVKAESKEDYMKKKRGNSDIYDTLYFQSTKCTDIFELQSELMHMKKVLAMLITPEQYAAIKCCGSSINDQIPFLLDRGTEQNKKQVGNADTEKLQVEMESQSLIQERTLNHIELIDKIDYDESYFHHKLDNFFKKSDKNFEGDDDYNKRMNQRLLACLNKTYGSHNETQ